MDIFCSQNNEKQDRQLATCARPASRGVELMLRRTALPIQSSIWKSYAWKITWSSCKTKCHKRHKAADARWSPVVLQILYGCCRCSTRFCRFQFIWIIINGCLRNSHQISITPPCNSEEQGIPERATRLGLSPFNRKSECFWRDLRAQHK